jgi:hypothetical protein
VPNRADLERLPRDELVTRARSLGVARPEVMTRVELADELVRLTETDPVARNKARGWFGIARDLVASLIDKGLNMPDAAELVRTTTRVVQRAPVATVTLAEIYAAQGHVRRALNMLGEVLTREPDHDVARRLRDRLSKDAPAESLAPEPSPDSVPVEAEIDEAFTEPPPHIAAEIDEAFTEPPQAVSPPSPPSPPSPLRVEPAVAVVEKSPEIHEESSLVVVKTGGEAWYLYWEIGNELAKDALIKIVAWVPRVTGAARIEREIRVTQASGGTMLPSFGARAVVRGVVGRPSASGFSPRAIASVIDRASDTPPWSPPLSARATRDAVEKRALASLEARPS